MTDEGPTTAGSIVAKLKMDRDQWVADKDRTKVEARELGALDPTITIKTNAAEAVAKLKAAQIAAEKTGETQQSAATKVSIAQLRQQATTDAADLAMRRLDAAIASGTVSEEKLAAMAEVASRTQQAQARSALLLAEAQTVAGAAINRETVAEEVNTVAKDKGNAANKTNISRIGLIVAGVSALVAMGAPLAGFTLGVAGGLTGMGAAGVLAILGIRREMALGTTTGSAYSAGIQVLLGDLHQLEATAAAGVLTGFTTAVSILNAAMPNLNSQVGVFSKMLGTGVDISLRGVLNTFQVLNPLFVTAGVFVNQLAAGFLTWTSNGGLQKFASYAMATLPVVEQTLGALADGAVHLVGALAPLGVVLLGALTIIGNLVTGLTTLLGPAFAPITAAVLLTVGAFKAWAAIKPIIDMVTGAVERFGIATLTMWGVVGLAVAAIGYLAAAWVGSSAAADTATAATQSYTAALQQDNGVIGEHVRLQAASNLQSAGALTSATKLGIATDTLVKASLGQAGAQKTVADAIDKVNKSTHANVDILGKQNSAIGAARFGTDSLSSAAAKLHKELSDQQSAIKAALKAYNDLAGAQGLATISTKAQLQAVQDNANAYRMSVPEYMAAQAAQKQTADQLRITTQNMVLQNDAAGLLKGTLDKLNGKAISAADAQNAFDSALVNMGTHVTATGKQITFTTDNIGNMSDASVSLRGQLNGQITALQGVVEANGGLANSTGKAHDEMVTMRQQIIDNAVAHGVNRDAVTAYIDKILSIPTSIPPTKFDIDTTTALAKLAFLKDGIAGVMAALAAAPAAARTSVGVDLSKLPSSPPSKWVPGHADGGTVTGIGGPTSDSVMRRMSVGEEVIRTASASFDRPFLKAYNANPQKALATAAAAGGGNQKTINNTWNISQADISGTITEIQRRQQAGAA